MTSATIRALWAEHTGGELSAPEWLYENAARFVAADVAGERMGDLFVYTRVPAAKFWPRSGLIYDTQAAALRAIRAAIAESALEVGT